MSLKTDGIFTALVTPYDDAGKVDHARLKRLVSLNRQNGVDRFYVCGSSAEMPLLSSEERRDILRTVLSCRPETVVAHVGGQNAAESFALARDAADAGADAVSAVTPYYYKYSFAELAHFYEKLADASGLPVVLYNIPNYAGVSFTVDQLVSLLKLDAVAALKFTSKDVYLIERVRRLCPDKPVYNGCDEILYSGLAAGAGGAIGATYNVMMDKAVRLYEAFGRGDMKTCFAVQSEINDVIGVTSRLGGLKCVKALLGMLGYPCGNLREPFEPLDESALCELREKVLPLLTLKREPLT